MADELMMHTFEVENVEKSGMNLENVIIGKIMSIKKHPGADKLQIVKVDIGKKLLNIVCGATNIKIGDNVPVALPGAKLANGVELAEVIIRGIRSEGMLVSEHEIGIGTDASGILILESKSRIGMSFKKYAGLDDYILDIKVLADRAHDCLSYVGMAREITTIENKKLRYDFDGMKLKYKKSAKLKIIVKEKKLCPRYIGAVMENVKISDSPLWLKSRLLASGIRPINNVVDATNYVMLELGQPLHAFDYKLIDGGQIVVRRAKRGEKIILLDGREINLYKEDLLICDRKKNLAIAGIMGNNESGIKNTTTTIVIESANFNPESIRQTRMKYGIKSDASERFEKGLDPNLAEKGIARVMEIIENISQGKPEGIVEVYSKKLMPWKINLNEENVTKLLGETVPLKKIVKILTLLGMKPFLKGEMISLSVPTYRLDLRTEEDLIEEIGRIYGYEKIKSIPPLQKLTIPIKNVVALNERMIRNILVGFGLDEIYNYSFYGEKDIQRADLMRYKHYEIENPMNPDQKYLRVSLMPGILKNISENIKNYSDLSIFEIGRVYLFPLSKGEASNKLHPVEKEKITIAAVLAEDNSAKTFFEIKGLASTFLHKLGISENNYEVIVPNLDETFKNWHPVRCAEILVNNKISVGIIGEVSPLTLSSYKITKRVAMAEFDLESLMNAIILEKNFKPIRKYPMITRDISLLVEEKSIVSEILDKIIKSGGKLVLNAELFDIFNKNGKNSMAFHINFGSNDRTLENKEIDLLMHKIIYALESDLNCKVRK